MSSVQAQQYIGLPPAYAANQNGEQEDNFWPNQRANSSISSGFIPSYYNTSIANSNVNTQNNLNRTTTPYPAPESNYTLPSYYNNDMPASGLLPGGFPISQSLASQINSNPSTLHNSSDYQVPSANSRTGTVPMPYYNPVPIAQFPMPMIYPPPPFVHPPMFFSQPAMHPFPQGPTAFSMPSLHMPSGPVSMTNNLSGGSVTHSVAVPSRSTNALQANSGEADETVLAREVDDQQATQENQPEPEPEPESEPELMPEQREKTAEEKKFEDRKALKMKIIGALKDGSVIMDVNKPALALIAQNVGAKAIVIIDKPKRELQRKYITAQAMVPRNVAKFVDFVAIPSIAMVRPGNTREIRALEKVGVDIIEETSRLDQYTSTVSVDKKSFVTPFMAGAKNLTHALKLIDEGAAIIRTDGEYDSGDCRKTLQALFQMREELEELKNLSDEDTEKYIKLSGASREVVLKTKKHGHLPVPYFAAGGISTPSDVSQARLIGCDGIITELSIFKGLDPDKRAAAIIKACKNYKDAKLISELSRDFRPEPN